MTKSIHDGWTPQPQVEEQDQPPAPAPWMVLAAQDTKAWLKKHLDAAILVGELKDTDVAYIVDLAEMGFRESFIRHAPQPAPDVAALVGRLKNERELLCAFEPERTNLAQLLTDAIAALTAASAGDAASEDSRRLDWLGKEGAIPLLVNDTWQVEYGLKEDGSANETSYGATIRQAIDAAMKEGKCP